MTKKLVFRALLVVMTGLSLHDLVGLAQGAMTPPGTFIPSARWKKMLDDDKPERDRRGSGCPNRAALRHSAAPVEGPNNASVHTKEGDGADVTEVYYILDGGGTHTTGGSMPDPRTGRPGSRAASPTTSSRRRHRDPARHGSLVQQDQRSRHVHRGTFPWQRMTPPARKPTAMPMHVAPVDILLIVIYCAFVLAIGFPACGGWWGAPSSSWPAARCRHGWPAWRSCRPISERRK